jgi:hypothetical protein
MLSELFDETFGGGGTTSAGPKIFPINVLMSDPLVEGGGAMTVFEGSGLLLPGKR